VAEVLALCAAFAFALAATLQQKGALGLGDALRSAKSYVRLAEQKWWLAGTGALLVGYVLQAIALDNGQLAIVQPLLVTTIVFALPLGYFLTDQIVNRKEIGAAVLVVVGLAVFTIAGDENTGRNDAPTQDWVAAIVVFGLIAAAFVLLGARGTLPRKAALLGAAAGILYGLSASLWKPTADALDSGGLGAMLSDWEFYAFAAAGLIAFVVQQVSLATGHLAASVATVSVCNPIVSIVIGILVLDETLADPTWHKVVAYIGLGAALFGAVLITRATEGVKERRRRPDAGAEPVPKPAT
jgi:drug/metabolite transporter (DMT)-like permease